MDNSADNFDNASVLEDKFREAAITAARSADPAPHDFDGESCYDCGTDMPVERLKHGFWTCVACKSVREKRNHLYRR